MEAGLAAEWRFLQWGTRPDAGFIGDIQVTAKKYVEAKGGTRFERPSTRFGKVTFDITAGYKLRPEEDFWGTGATPGSLRTNYDLQERSGAARIEIAPYKTFRSGIEARYSATSIFDGKDSRFLSTGTVFGSTLPGFNGAELSETSLFAEYDTRNGNTAPVKAFYAMGRISSVDGMNGGNFSYWQYCLDQRTYLPLWSNRRVLAVRTLAMFNDTKGNAEIPFFRLARLGDSQTLRGYDSYRFYGRNATAWNMEYRTDLTGALGAFAFTDFGQVFDRRADFGARNFRVTYGGGLQIKSKKSIILRTYLARSEERTRFMVSFGPTF